LAPGDGVVDAQAGGIRPGHGVVVGVGVAVELLRVLRVDDRVDAEEPAGARVIFAGAEVGQSGAGVGGAVDEPAVAGQGRGSRAGFAERVEAAGW
jgi:hypothetical protein